MFIKQILTETEKAFTAILKCQFCSNEQNLLTGFNSNFYKNVIVKNITCQKCGKQSENTVIRSR